jgi:hypothetical protein
MPTPSSIRIGCSCDCGSDTIDNGPNVVNICGYDLPQYMRLVLSGFPNTFPAMDGQAFANTTLVMEWQGVGAPDQWCPVLNGNGPVGSAAEFPNFLTYFGDQTYNGVSTWAISEIRIAVYGGIDEVVAGDCPPDGHCACRAILSLTGSHQRMVAPFNIIGGGSYPGIYPGIYDALNHWTYDYATDTAFNVTVPPAPFGQSSDGSIGTPPELWDVDMSQVFIWRGSSGESAIFKR